MSTFCVSNSQTNDFKIGMFGFNYMTTNNLPVNTLEVNGFNSSSLNILEEDGFNIVTNYQPNSFGCYQQWVERWLDLIDLNNLEVMVEARNWYLPEITAHQHQYCIGPETEIFNNYNTPLTETDVARPNYDALISNVYNNAAYSDMIWGHQISEEATSWHVRRGYRAGTPRETICDVYIDIPVTSFEIAINHFRNTLNNATIGHQLLIDMEEAHGKSINDNLINGGNGWDPRNDAQDYIKINGVDYFFEGSYTGIEDDWNDQHYVDIFNNGYHYLGNFKSIDYAYNYVQNVHKVVNIEHTSHGSNYASHYHSDLSIENANWLWFLAYTSIIHKVKGIWFWSLYHSWEENEMDPNWPNWNNRFERNQFPDAYNDFVRHLARELRYLKNIDILSDDNSNILYTKTDHADNYGIVPPANTYINPNHIPEFYNSLAIGEHRSENYGLRYSIRTNGFETIMIISNPLNVAIEDVTLSFKNIDDPIIRNATSVEFLFESSSYPNGYKTDRNSNIDLDNNTVGVKYVIDFNGALNLDFEPVDVHIIRFVPHTGYNDNNLHAGEILSDSEIEYYGGKLYYLRSDKIFSHLYRSNNQWNADWIAPTAPKCKTGKSYTVCNLGIVYVTEDNYVYRIYYSDGWTYSKLLNSQIDFRNDSEFHHYNGKFYYTRNDGKYSHIYQSGGTWHSDWLTGISTPAKSGVGFFVTSDIYVSGLVYIDRFNRLRNIYWNGSSWQVKTLLNNINVRNDSKLKYQNSQIYYVRTDDYFSNISKVGTSWIVNLVNPENIKVKNGTGFCLGDGISYIDNSLNINNLKNNYGWSNYRINTSSSNLTGARIDSDIEVGDGYIFIVNKNDNFIHSFEYVYSIPFTNAGSNSNSNNLWDLKYSDGADFGHKVYLSTETSISATVCNSYTNFDTKMEIFNIDGTSTQYYNDNDLNCSYGQIKSTLNYRILPKGYYYIVVDGKNAETGNFDLSVTGFEVNKESNTRNSKISSKSNNLKKTDFNDNTELNIESKRNIKVFPNPVQEYLYITLPDDSQYKIEIIDFLGRSEKLIYIQGRQVEINCFSIKTGIYFLKITSSETLYIQKLVIER